MAGHAAQESCCFVFHLEGKLAPVNGVTCQSSRPLLRNMPFSTSWSFPKSQKVAQDGIKEAVNSLTRWNLVDCQEDKGNIVMKATRTNKRGWIYDVEVVIHAESPNEKGTMEVQVDFNSRSRETLYDLSFGQNRRNSEELHFAIPWTPKSFSKKRKVQVPEEVKDLVTNLLDKTNGLDVRDRVSLSLATYTNSFVASELVDWVLEFYKMLKEDYTRKEAIDQCVVLAELQIIGHAKDAVVFTDDQFAYWKFQVTRREIAEQSGDAISTQDLAKVYALMTDTETGMKVADKSYLLIKVKNAFKGDEAVNWMKEKFEMEREEAVALCKALLDGKYLARIPPDRSSFSESNYYRLKGNSAGKMKEEEKYLFE